MRRHAAVLLTILAAATLGCGEIKRMAEDMIAIQKCVRDRGATNSIGIHLGANKAFRLDLTNSPLDTLADSLRMAAAKHVAECVRDDYHRYPELSGVEVAFIRGKSAGPVKITASGNSYTFSRAQLGTSGSAARDSTAAAPKSSN